MSAKSLLGICTKGAPFDSRMLNSHKISLSNRIAVLLCFTTHRFGIARKPNAADYLRCLRTARTSEATAHQVPLLSRRVCDLCVVWRAVLRSTVQVPHTDERHSIVQRWCRLQAHDSHLYLLTQDTAAAVCCCCCRAARVVIMTDAAYRAKFSVLLDWRYQAAVMIGVELLMLCIPVYMQTTDYAKTDDYCLAFQPWGYWLGVLLGMTPPVALLFYKLQRVHDTLGLHHATLLLL
jgi:hypothetical protein